MNYENILSKVEVDKQILEQFPTYSCLILQAQNIINRESNEISNDLLNKAEKTAQNLLSKSAIEEIPEIKLWRDAYMSFGVKPRIAKSSVESLLKRSEKGIPRIDFLTDVYNSLSIKYLIPIGGENLDKYVGAPKLTKSNGKENYETVENGIIISTNPEINEIIWRDDLGVTCRRWNWRQCLRTRLTQDTKNAIFIFDNLGKNSTDKLLQAKTELTDLLCQFLPGIEFNFRVLTA